jgi:uncharacterized integral membrane protein
MRIRVLPVLLVVLLAGLFALVNWTTFTTPTQLNLGVALVTAPLGLVMLGFVVVLALMYVGSVVFLQGSALMESRRLSRDLQAQRELADKAEASRFTELREFMNAELARQTQANDQLRAALFTRLDELEHRQRTVMEQNANTLSSYIGELEDRMEHRLVHPEAVRDARDLPPPDYRR